MTAILGDSDHYEITIDVPHLLETRLLVQASSGGGKSWTLRRILEQTANKVQHLIIDPEGEFATLREKFDYIIAAAHHGDALAHPRTATLLARRLLETGVSAILDIYDLKAHERQAFVRNLCVALVDAPKKLWHPLIVVLDEAHVYAPEKGHAESTGAVIDLVTRGRKRGFCTILATTRLSKLHKDAAAEMMNKLIGRTGLDVDVRRAADELGMNYRDAMSQLRGLKPGEFYCFGPALTNVVTKVKIGSVKTTHPKVGQRLLAAPPAPSAKIKNVLSKLADLPKEAEQEARTMAELRTHNAQLKRELASVKRAAPKAPMPKPVEIPLLKKQELESLRKAVRHALDTVNRVEAAQTRMTETAKALSVATREIAEAVKPIAIALGKKTQQASVPARSTQSQPVIRPHNEKINGNSHLTGPEQRIIDAIAWFEALGIGEPQQAGVAFLSGYTYGGGGFNNPRGALRTKGFVQYVSDKRIALTDNGREFACPPDLPPISESLHRAVLDILPGPERKLLHTLIEAYPESLMNEELAERAGYKVGSGGFNNPRGRLRTLGLIGYPESGHVRANDLLFPT